MTTQTIEELKTLIKEKEIQIDRQAKLIHDLTKELVKLQKFQWLKNELMEME
jgi:uncharacterized coiled-coil protein SlyX